MNIKYLKQNIKREIYEKMAKSEMFFNLLRKILIKRDYCLDKRIDRLLMALSKRHDVFFVNVGANDGIKNDFLFLYINKFKWKGILIEPLQEVYDRLVKNYNGLDVTFEKLAIADYMGEIEFFKSVREGQGLYIDDQIGSLNKSITNLNAKNNGMKVEKIIVKCDRLDKLLERNKVSRIDILNIDVEGSEPMVFSQLDLIKFRPYVIIFEYSLLTKEQLNAILDMVKNQGYNFYFREFEVVCWRDIYEF